MPDDQSSAAGATSTNLPQEPKENFISRLRNLFRRRTKPVPFRKPKYTRDKDADVFLDADRLIDLYQPHRTGLDDGRRNYPPVDIEGETVFESQVKAHCNDALRRLSRQTQHQLIVRNNEQMALDIGPIFAHDIDRAKAIAAQDFQLLKNESLDNLRKLKRTELKRERDLRHFRHVNELHREARPEHSFRVVALLLILMILVEGSLNAVVFQQVYDYGYIGGFLIAMVIGTMNVLVCFFFGRLCIRNTVHVNQVRRRVAYILTIIFILMWVFLHYCVGRARAFIETTNSSSGLQNLFDQHVSWTLLSFLLIAMGIFFSAIAILEGCIWSGDMYPGFGAETKAQEAAVQRYVAARRQLSADALALIAQAKQKIDTVIANAESNLLKYTGIMHEIGAILRLFNESATQMETACDRVLKKYREANLHVRTQIPPAYFRDSYTKLDRDIGTDVEDASGRLKELNRLVDELKVEAEKAKNELQMMLAGQLKDLDEEMDAIDATILPLTEADPSAPEQAAGLKI